MSADNAYECKCGESINEVPEKQYFIPDDVLAKFIEKNYKSEKNRYD